MHTFDALEYQIWLASIGAYMSDSKQTGLVYLQKLEIDHPLNLFELPLALAYFSRLIRNHRLLG